MHRIPLQRRMQIVTENQTILRDGGYTLADGSFISLPCNESIHTAIRCDETVPVRICDHNAANAEYQIRNRLMMTDTVSCILQLRRAGEQGRILALNFANAMVPGGGYRIGGQAQEESLCRSTLLYESIRRAKGFYSYHRLHPTPLYSDRVLYSRDIPVIRTADGTLLETPCLCDFLTAAAVNRRLASPWYTERQIDSAMQKRIDAVLAAAVRHKPDILILGAFGCGAFGNRRETVLPMFETAIRRMIPNSMTVWFAIPDGVQHERNEE